MASSVMTDSPDSGTSRSVLVAFNSGREKLDIMTQYRLRLKVTELPASVFENYGPMTSLPPNADQ